MEILELLHANHFSIQPLLLLGSFNEA